MPLYTIPHRNNSHEIHFFNPIMKLPPLNEAAGTRTCITDTIQESHKVVISESHEAFSTQPDKNLATEDSYFDVQAKLLPPVGEKSNTIEQELFEIAESNVKNRRNSGRNTKLNEEISKALLEVTIMEHKDAMQKSFRSMARLRLTELHKLLGVRNLKSARAVIFWMRQMNANHKTALLRQHALRQRQTVVGNTHHIRYYPPRQDHGHRCYFCPCGFETVTELHAHLSTQEHVCLDLPLTWTQWLRERRIKSHRLITHQKNNSNCGMNSQRPIPSGKPDYSSIPKCASLPQRNDLYRSNKAQEDRTVKVMLSCFRCIYCGRTMKFHQESEHQCFQEMNEFLRRETQHMNQHGSPFVCLLCHGRVFDSPTQLQLHLVAFHGSQTGDHTTCSLCGVEFRKPAFESQQSRQLKLVVYYRHLVQQHLPSLLLTEKLLYMGVNVIRRSVTDCAPIDNSVYRSYRCVFHNDRPAGDGKPFPFAHWLNEYNASAQRIRRVEPDASSQVVPIVSRRSPIWDNIFRIHIPTGNRPSKQRSYRSCLVSPVDMFEQLVSRLPQLASAVSNSKQLYCPAGRKGGLNDLAKLTTHVLCVHAGNPYTIAGFEDLVKARHVLHRVNKGLYSSLHIDPLAGEWIKQNRTPTDSTLLRSPLATRHIHRPTVISKLRSQPASIVEGSHTNSNNTSRLSKIKEDKQLYSLYLVEKKTKGPVDFVQVVKTNKRQLTGDAARRQRHKERHRRIKRKASASRKTDMGQTDMGKENLQQSALVGPKVYRDDQRTSYSRIKRWSSHTFSDLRSLLESVCLHQNSYCRACLAGPFEISDLLDEHIHREHATSLHAQLIHLRKTEAFSGLVDPMRTCFQCYSVLIDHCALQVHMVVMHGSRYPLVCGLCKEPLVNLEVDGAVFRECLNILEKNGVCVTEEKLRALISPEPAWKIVYMEQVEGAQTSNNEPTYTIEGLDELVKGTQEIEELRAILASMKAQVAVATYSPELALQAMQLHEQRHYKTIRERYLPDVIGEGFEKEQIMLNMQLSCLTQGVGPTMAQQYREVYLAQSEQHEQQLQLRKIRFGMDVWESCTRRDDHKLTVGGILNARKTIVDTKHKSSQKLPEELRRIFSTARTKTSSSYEDE
ncbi:hypothetical protein T265_09118 [Opisthorchis viverrini]|uniref:C2H2-type domain-containing protein n=1 Tax=Opisthorchis viverrini TaxID=6198 RepID=A0A074Z6S0_OPIVI|nr:hypothetical protein T265_09118 [Opisthorchis viverrini]KER22886.1 hypothetical protein T265_09118 [Opisthorchis viverrini]